ncbi:hypothetical protein EDB89DRAFT_2228925 [Lactarius sanguifluus]|nr:hypothetical protein EDB89DRAFT_2228925 [Lactarius sanguifluus]
MKMTPTATRRQWRRPRLRRQRGDDSAASNSATTMRKEGRKTYIEQLECIVTKPQTMFTHSPEQVVALPPPTLHIRELDQEVPSCFARTTNCGSDGRTHFRIKREHAEPNVTRARLHTFPTSLPHFLAITFVYSLGLSSPPFTSLVTTTFSLDPCHLTSRLDDASIPFDTS